MCRGDELSTVSSPAPRPPPPTTPGRLRMLANRNIAQVPERYLEKFTLIANGGADEQLIC